MEVIRTPALKSAGKNKEESAEEYQERVYQDAISRPSFYFLGYNPKTHRYGKKFYRSEFDLDEIKSRYLHVFRELYDARVMDGWYRNDRVCNNVLPGIECDMKSCCRNGNMSETVYQIRKKKIKF
jgi:spore coat polysaccharide biosynthesis protein SpsF (cytidylyltransferase family)